MLWSIERGRTQFGCSNPPKTPSAPLATVFSQHVSTASHGARSRACTKTPSFHHSIQSALAPRCAACACNPSSRLRALARRDKARHVDGRLRPLNPVVVLALAEARAREGLRLREALEHPEDDGLSLLEVEAHEALRDGLRDVLKVHRLALDEAADREDGIRTRVERDLRAERELLRAGHLREGRDGSGGWGVGGGGAVALEVIYDERELLFQLSLH
jgi:hypothetical protein